MLNCPPSFNLLDQAKKGHKSLFLSTYLHQDWKDHTNVTSLSTYPSMEHKRAEK